MSEYEIEVCPRMAIKGRALADFVAEFFYTLNMGRAKNDSTNDFHYGFQASNNEVEYEALIIWIELRQTLGAKNLRIHCDSQLIVNQIKDDYTAKEPKMVVYLANTNSKLDAFSWFEILQIPRKQNSEADALTRLGSGIDEDGLGTVLIEYLPRPSNSCEGGNSLKTARKPRN